MSRPMAVASEQRRRWRRGRRGPRSSTRAPGAPGRGHQDAGAHGAGLRRGTRGGPAAHADQPSRARGGQPRRVEQPDPGPPRPRSRTRCRRCPRPRRRPSRSRPRRSRTATPVKREPAPRSESKVAPAPGETPSTGIDAVNIKTPGLQFAYPEYLRNIVSQVYRRWDRPGGNQALRAEVSFFILRDGSVRDIRFVTPSGNFSFDLERPGRHRGGGQREGLRPAARRVRGGRPAGELLLHAEERAREGGRRARPAGARRRPARGAGSDADRGVRVGITYTAGTRPRLVILPGAGLDSVRAILQRDLDFSDRFEVLPLESGGAATGSTVNYQLYRTLGAEYGVDVRSDAAGVVVRLHDIGAGTVRQQQPFALARPVGPRVPHGGPPGLRRGGPLGHRDAGRRRHAPAGPHEQARLSRGQRRRGADARHARVGNGAVPDLVAGRPVRRLHPVSRRHGPDHAARPGHRALAAGVRDRVAAQFHAGLFARWPVPGLRADGPAGRHRHLRGQRGGPVLPSAVDRGALRG